MSKDVQTMGSKPMGLKGRIAGLLMNAIHANQYRKIIKHLLVRLDTGDAMSILDIGCGGGNAIKLFRALARNATVHGVDHSPDMVALAREVNRTGVNNGHVDIVEGDVTVLPYEDSFFDIITAFDTINFWTDSDQAMREIGRVLKENGVFVIVNGYPREGTKWWDFVKFKSIDEYRDMLSEHGFKDTKIILEKNTIIIEAHR